MHTEQESPSKLWEEVAPLDVVELTLGPGLLPLVDDQRRQRFLDGIAKVRLGVSREVGFVLRPVHVQDNLDLPTNDYRITIHGTVVATGQVYPDRDIAICTGSESCSELAGIEVNEPCFGIRSFWVAPESRQTAVDAGFYVTDPGTVVSTHLHKVLKAGADQLLGHDEAGALTERLEDEHPRLAARLEETISGGSLLHVLRGILRVGGSLRQFRSVAEALVETYDGAGAEAHGDDAVLRVCEYLDFQQQRLLGLAEATQASA